MLICNERGQEGRVVLILILIWKLYGDNLSWYILIVFLSYQVTGPDVCFISYLYICAFFDYVFRLLQHL